MDRGAATEENRTSDAPARVRGSRQLWRGGVRGRGVRRPSTTGCRRSRRPAAVTATRWAPDVAQPIQAPPAPPGPARSIVAGGGEGGVKKIEHIWQRIGSVWWPPAGAWGSTTEIEVRRGLRAAQNRRCRRSGGTHSDAPCDGSKLTHPGVYCLRSNQTDWDADDDVATSYIMLTDLEAVFRSFKSELGLRPICSSDRCDAPRDICSSSSA